MGTHDEVSDCEAAAPDDAMARKFGLMRFRDATLQLVQCESSKNGHAGCWGPLLLG